MGNDNDEHDRCVHLTGRHRHRYIYYLPHLDVCLASSSSCPSLSHSLSSQRVTLLVDHPLHRYRHRHRHRRLHSTDQLSWSSSFALLHDPTA